MSDSKFMLEALKEAKNAFKQGEVPVGAVIVSNGKIVAKGQNKRETEHNSLCHAEIEAINEACRVLGRWRLDGCILYVTLEPCPMCTGAIINSRIDRVVFGAYDEKAGSMGTMVNLCELDYNHRPAIVGGYMESECKQVLTEFFSGLRK
ncbi:MAG: nucleoside deaminase [Clostridia bacterium]|nr:nucleoside deaminase [Clostridia bacterium]